MKKIDLSNVPEATEYKVLPAGGYICRLNVVEDVPEKEYLKIEFDIDAGEFKGHYQELFAKRGFWAGRMFRSYKETALPFFKSFTTALEKSNPGYQWDNDETKLVDKVIGIVLAEEEYIGNDGNVKTKLVADRVHSIEAIKKGDYKTPPKKFLAGSPNLIKNNDPAGFNAFSTDATDDQIF